MKLPKQAQPVWRTLATAAISGTGVNPSAPVTINTEKPSTRDCNVACAVCARCGG